MARSRADDILNAWRAAAHSATRPALAPRSARIQPAVPFGILVATAVVLVLLVARGPRGQVIGPAASFPAGGAPAAVPSADPCTAAPNAGTQLVTIEQGPMRPLLVPGDVVSVTSLAAADLQRGDVVAFDPTTWLKGAAPVPFVMRIVALGGDQVAIRDGHVFVNGAQLDEPYVFAGDPTVVQSAAAATWKIPADNMFVLGDNRSSAADSRTYGPLPVAAIIGRVTYRCEPLSRRGPIASTVQLSSASPSPSTTAAAETPTPADVAAAKQAVTTYTADLVRGDYAAAYPMLGPEAQAHFGSLSSFTYDQRAFFQSVAGRFTVTPQPSDVGLITDWLPTTYGASIDLAHAVLVEVTYPAMAGNNAGYSLFIVNPTATGLRLYDVR